MFEPTICEANHKVEVKIYKFFSSCLSSDCTSLERIDLSKNEIEDASGLGEVLFYYLGVFNENLVKYYIYRGLQPNSMQAIWSPQTRMFDLSYWMFVKQTFGENWS